jgi:transcriptional regulator with XRE-family HTH domain
VSVKQEWAQLAARLRAEGRTRAEIARALRDHALSEERFELSPLTALRLAHGWTQHDAAREWTARWPKTPKTYKDFSNWETGRHTPRLDIFDKLAQLYTCDLADLLADRPSYRSRDPKASTKHAVDDLSTERQEKRSGTHADAGEAVVVPGSSGPSALAGDAADSRHAILDATTSNDLDEVDVDRRSFVTGAVVAALRLPAPMRGLLVSEGGPVTTAQVEVVASYLEALRQQDAAIGADGVLGVAITLHERTTTWLADGSLPTAVYDTLQRVRADLGAHVGWLAFDAGHSEMARRYLQDTIVHARLADHQSAEICAMSCMCLLLNRAGRPREALECAQAAHRIAAPWATPRLRSLLHLRTAAAHAELGDPAAFVTELHNAEAELDRGHHDDDLPWTRFVAPQELVGLAGHSYRVIGRPDLAASALRSIIEDPDPGYHRNVVLYTVLLAHALAQQGDITQAAAVGLDALSAVKTLRSQRTRRELRSLRWTLDQHRSASRMADEFADAYDHG